MTMINLGKWAQYTPAEHPEFAPVGTIFWRNEEGADWYEFSRNRWPLKEQDEVVKVVVLGGRVRSVATDASGMTPDGDCLFELSENEAAPQTSDYFYDGAFHKEPPAPEPVDPTTRTITKRQLVAALIIGAGVTEPDAFIEGAIALIPDATGRALALNDWRNAPYYVRGHALFNDPAMLGAIGKSPGEIDQLWALAVTLPA